MKKIIYILIFSLFFIVGMVNVSAEEFNIFGVKAYSIAEAINKELGGFTRSNLVCRYEAVFSGGGKKYIDFPKFIDENIPAWIINYSDNQYIKPSDYIKVYSKQNGYLPGKVSSEINIDEIYDETNKNCMSNFYLVGEKEHDNNDIIFNMKFTRNASACDSKESDDCIIIEYNFKEETLSTPFNVYKDYSMDLSGCIIDKGTQDIINWVLSMMRLVGIILLIVLGMLDFIKAAASGEQEEMKKSKGKFVKRLIACIVLFFIPIIVNILLGLVNMAGGENCFETTKTEETSNTN